MNIEIYNEIYNEIALIYDEISRDTHTKRLLRTTALLGRTTRAQEPRMQECRAALLGVDGTVQVDPSGESCSMLVRLERVQVTVLALSHVNDLGYEVYS